MSTPPVLPSLPTISDSGEAAAQVALSVLVPLYQEEDNVAPLCERLFAVLSAMDCSFEVIAIDDGSRDQTLKHLQAEATNRIISWTSGVYLRDYGCTLKAYRADILKGIRLYGEMHRFIPIYASWMGAPITEMPVRHHPRRFGQSKYGLERIGKVILDLMVVKFLERYFVKPIYVFGAFGLVSMVLSGMSFAAMLYLRLIKDVSMILTPLPLLTVLFFLVGVMGILMGLLAEALVRTYYESQGRAAYLIRKTVNFGPARPRQD